jgi:hypothetical protein
MKQFKGVALVLLGLLVGCGGSSKPAERAEVPDDLEAEDVREQTRDACEQLRDCELISEGQIPFDECVERGLYTVEDGTKACVKAYYRFEMCVANLGCDDLEELFKKKSKSAPCRNLAAPVQKECNISVL